MLALPLSLLLISATVALHADETRDVDTGSVERLLDDLGREIRARTGINAVVHPFDPSRACSRDPDRCAVEILDATGAEDVVRLRIFGVPSKLRILAEVQGRTVRQYRRAQIDLAREPSRWSSSITALALALFPASEIADLAGTGGPGGFDEKMQSASLAPSSQALEPAGRTYPWHWVAIGGAVLAGGTGLALGIENRRLRSEGMSPGTSAERVDELRGLAYSTGLGANVAYGLAAAGLIAGITLLLVDY